MIAAVPAPEAATGVVVDVADSILDAALPYIQQHPAWLWVVGALAVVRVLQPVLWALSQRTRTKWDDKAVKALAWLVGAVERRKDK